VADEPLRERGRFENQRGSSITEGIGTGRVIANLDGTSINDALRISDEQTKYFVYRRLREESPLARRYGGNKRRGRRDAVQAIGPGRCSTRT